MAERAGSASWAGRALGLEHAVQLAAYAGGQLWDPVADAALSTPNIDTARGYIVHLPAGEGRCEIHQIDLEAGRKAAELAVNVLAVRKAAKAWTIPAPQGPPVAVQGVETPKVDPDRRRALLDRYGALSDADKEAFAKWVADNEVDKTDLDGIEAALEAVDAFADVVIEPAPMRETPEPPPIVDWPTPDEGPPVADDVLDHVRATISGLDDPSRSWLVAAGAKCRLGGTNGVPSQRRFEIVRGLVTLARAGFDNDDVARSVAAIAADRDDWTAPTVDVARAVAALDGAEAARFARLCTDVADKTHAVAYQLDGRLTFDPPLDVVRFEEVR